MKDQPLTPEDLNEIEDNTAEYVGYAGIIVDQLVATVRAAWAERDRYRHQLGSVAAYVIGKREGQTDIVQKEVNRKTLADARRQGREEGLEEAATRIEDYEYDTDGTPWSPEGCKAELAEAIRALKGNKS